MQKNLKIRWTLAGVILFAHILFLMGMAWTPEWYATPLSTGGVFNIGMLIGLVLLIFPLALMLYYFGFHEAEEHGDEA